MNYEIISRSPKTKEFVASLMPGLIRELNLENTDGFIIVEVARGICPGAQGTTRHLAGLKSYIIAIAPQKKESLGSTLAHEMVHVKQFAKGQFRIQNNKQYWRGKQVAKSTKYLDLPWEMEAFAKQEILFRRVIED